MNDATYANVLLSTLQVLIEEKANVDKRTRTGSSALHYACVYNHTDCVDVLIEARAQVNGRDHRKATPVMFAAMKGNVGIINTLVQAGADVS